jgi:hypothetical protein
VPWPQPARGQWEVDEGGLWVCLRSISMWYRN